MSALQNEASDFRTGGAVSLAVGSIAGASAMALALKWTLDDLNDKEHEVRVQPMMGPSTAGVMVTGAF